MKHEGEDQLRQMRQIEEEYFAGQFSVDKAVLRRLLHQASRRVDIKLDLLEEDQSAALRRLSAYIWKSNGPRTTH